MNSWKLAQFGFQRYLFEIRYMYASGGKMAADRATLRILLPVDGSENSDRAVQLLIGLYERFAPVEVRVLHVVGPVFAGDALSRQEAAERNSADRGRDALQSAQALLDGAGIPHTREIREGYVPQEIVRYAKETQCTGIIMGTRGMGTTDEIFGSVVRQVIALASIPVTLVK